MKKACLWAVMLVLVSTCFLIAENKVYFSPKDNVSAIIVSEIAQAKHTIDIAIFGFTDLDIAQALIDADRKGLVVRVYRDKLQSSEKKQKEVNRLLQESGISLRIKPTGILMHMKAMIIDGKILVTGSYNWSDGAKKQDNDLSICSDPCEVLPQYINKFKEMGFVYAGK